MKGNDPPAALPDLQNRDQYEFHLISVHDLKRLCMTITPCAQTPPSSPLHGEPAVAASELLHPPLHHQRDSLLPVGTIRAQKEPATLLALNMKDSVIHSD